ncbi:hypothetical protein N7638_17480 [Achromobacter mucicolens]|uniref:Uncharacterized protein n=1 Tax=Achromobacter aegrifaciens TaxID=1287736 RepID=A0AAD2KLX6_ACHAE|nr:MULTISPECIES: hypothetical protein [Achromobacter]MDG9969836.1 hypothetical protein [Achromobacter mucicolens]CAB3894468.1 hypothetical protein LMG26684_04271 [Achromobacter mucicolens]CUJ70556.1 Uncharacterised protein [Achromobacter aegrifaciens]
MRFFVEENNLNAVVKWYETYPSKNQDDGFDLRGTILKRLNELYLPRLADFEADPAATAKEMAFACVYGPIFAYPDFETRANSDLTDFIMVNLYVRPRLDEVRGKLLEVSVG